jgi:hypothetical protein
MRLRFVGRSIKGIRGKAYGFAVGNFLEDSIYIPLSLMSNVEKSFVEMGDKKNVPAIEFDVPEWYCNKNLDKLGERFSA